MPQTLLIPLCNPIYLFSLLKRMSPTLPLIITLNSIYLPSPSQVYVEVVDVNDHLPLSSWPVYWPVVAENAPPGTMVVAVNATDPDPGANISYAITAGNPQSLFSIDAKTGECVYGCVGVSYSDGCKLR